MACVIGRGILVLEKFATLGFLSCWSEKCVGNNSSVMGADVRSRESLGAISQLSPTQQRIDLRPTDVACFLEIQPASGVVSGRDERLPRVFGPLIAA